VKPESGENISIWADTFDVPEFGKLKEDLQTDVIIVGAGITGLTAGCLLSTKGIKVVLVDDGNIGGGETARTTAHITNVIDDRYYNISRLHGEKAARLAADSQTAGINLIRELAAEYNIECELKTVDGFLLFSPNDPADELEREYEACKLAGVEVYIEPQAPLETFKSYPCLRFPGQAEFHALKYISGLAKIIENYGGKIFTHTHASKIEDSNEEVRKKVKVKCGDFTITADNAVVATNSPISDYVAIHTKQTANRTYVIAAEIPGEKFTEALFWDTENPYHYIRKYKNKGNTYLLVGGEDHKTGQEEDPEERFIKLERWMRDKFSYTGKVVYKWSGQVMEPIDGLGFIGKDPENSESVYISTGDSGMGITHSAFSAILLTDLITGQPNEWKELYDPGRITLKAAPQFISEGVNMAVQYIDIITPPEVSSTEEITSGEGAIIGTGVDKLAVYKDNDGRVYTFSALCPHLKCIVQWNKTEKTWDCPCHGSRFEATGNVINGPALNGLKKHN
jgi:glycine/D-amino acid oxidase-like deaminating enzyme/nitrite reductase/ring-hydroxylating ferredoxin subunit